MISVASFLRGEPKDFDFEKNKSVDKEDDCTFPEKKSYERSEPRVAYFCNYEQYSTFKPKEYPRPAMELPFRVDDLEDDECERKLVLTRDGNDNRRKM